MHAVEYGSHQISYSVERRERSTLEISVSPDGSVQVVAPVDATAGAIEARVAKRARWVLEQQRYFAQFLPRTPKRRWVPGETHLYLGRQYRLRVVASEASGGPSDAVLGSVPAVKMARGFITVAGVEFEDSANIERLVTAWLRGRAEVQLRHRLEQCLTLFHPSDAFVPTSVQVRTMRTHWGSMSPAGRLSLNPDLVRAPVDAIDYVIVHELCHRAVPTHSREFYETLARVMPDWQRRKLRLERALA